MREIGELRINAVLQRANVAKLHTLSPPSKKLVPIYLEMLQADGRDDLIA